MTIPTFQEFLNTGVINDLPIEIKTETEYANFSKNHPKYMDSSWKKYCALLKNQYQSEIINLLRLK